MIIHPSNHLSHSNYKHLQMRNYEYRNIFTINVKQDKWSYYTEFCTPISLPLILQTSNLHVELISFYMY